jgi:hypothetical protein
MERNTDANLHDLSIKPNLFIQKLESNDSLCLIAMYTIVNNFKLAVYSHLDCIDIRDRVFCFDKIIILNSLGFTEEACTLMDQLGMHILEITPEQTEWLADSIISNNLVWYIQHVDEKASINGKSNIFAAPVQSSVRHKIFLEEFRVSADQEIVYATYFIKGTENIEGVKPKEAAILYNDIVLFASGMDLDITKDSCDHNGEHIQSVYRMDLATFILERMDSIIKEYIEGGNKLIGL